MALRNHFSTKQLLAAIASTSAFAVIMIGAFFWCDHSSATITHSVLSAPKSKNPSITFTHDIAPILDSQCVTCHRAGEVAPFTLTNYATAKEHAQMLAIVTAKRVMPPWHASSGYGDFAGVRHLTDTQIAALQKWVDEGEPMGDPKYLPPTPQFPDGWTLGKPDLVLKMPEAYHVPADGPDIYQCFVIPTNIADDRYVSAVEFKAGDPKVVHHCIMYLDRRHLARKLLDANDPGAGFRSFGGPGFLPTGALGGWAPGAYPHFEPEGVANYMAGGSDVVLQVHYHPTGKPEVDQSQIGIYFSKGPVTAITAGITLWQPHIDIQPGDSQYALNAGFTVPVDCKAIGIVPHMHLLGRQMKVTATLPNGMVKPMIWVKDWNFNWQDQYRYANPVDLPAGTRLQMEAIYDNSDANPYNPNSPPKEVLFGEQTTDEMSLCVVQVITDKPEDRQTLVRSVIRNFIGVGTAFNAPV